jgi:hypothetical protein
VPGRSSKQQSETEESWNAVNVEKQDDKALAHLMMRWRASADGGVGRSGGRCGNNVGINSGWEVNSGVKFAGVRMSVKENSAKLHFRINQHRPFEDTPGAAGVLLLLPANKAWSCASCSGGISGAVALVALFSSAKLG